MCLRNIIESFIKKPCQHVRNTHCRTFFSKDGTPMVSFVCHDCGYTDNGHVHADPETWKCKETVVKNGKTTINEKHKDNKTDEC